MLNCPAIAALSAHRSGDRPLRQLGIVPVPPAVPAPDIPIVER
jgi:hypothetical protein